MPTGVYLRMNPPWPYCPGCGMPIEMGRTVRGRRAWFCLSWSCRWYQMAVAGVYLSKTDTLEHFRALLRERRS